MTAVVRPWESEAEAEVLGRLRAGYEAQGFTFALRPDASDLPPFFGDFRPDAVARGPDHSVVIEVKKRGGRPDGRALDDIQRLLAARPGWRFRIVVPGSDPLDAVAIDGQGPDAVRRHQREVRGLAAQGHRRAAFVLAWAVLEAAFRSREGAGRRAQAAAAVVQALAMAGRIDADMDRRLRALIDLRNRVVHGDLAAEPVAADIEAVLSAVDEALETVPA